MIKPCTILWPPQFLLKKHGQTAEQELNTAITAEESRARAAEQSLAQNIIDAVEGAQSDWNVDDESNIAHIKNKPTSLPASGGNADTVGGKRDLDFATNEQGQKAETALALAQSLKSEINTFVKIIGFNINDEGELLMTYTTGELEEN